jgi:proteasome lid subunit RPN8/RPN11
MNEKEFSMIRISEETLQKIKQHGEETYPEECCGMMLGSNDGDSRTIEETIEINNSQGENRRRRFLIKPRQYFQAERTASEKRKELLGFYHSHPDHPAEPSAFDTEHALPHFIYVIVSVSEGRAKNVTAWSLSEDRSHFEESPLSVITQPGQNDPHDRIFSQALLKGM